MAKDKIENGLKFEEIDGKPIILVNYFDPLYKKQYCWRFRTLTVGEFKDRPIINPKNDTYAEGIEPIMDLLNAMRVDGPVLTIDTPIHVLNAVRGYMKDFL